MITLGNYLLQMTCWLAAFWLVYVFLLKKETYFQLNRWFLNLGLMVAVLAPLIPVRYNVQVLANAYTASLSEVSNATVIEDQIALNYWLIAYGLGIVFFVARFIIQHAKLYRLRKRSASFSIDSFKVYQLEKETAPFSFFNQIYVSSKLSNTTELETVVAHEKVHIHERHWADLLLLEVVRTLQWFNPLLYFYRKAIMQNHEYLADSGTLEFGVSARTYRTVLANQMLGIPVVQFANSFTFFNSSKRILMMKKDKSTPIKRLKILLIVPLMAIIVMGFAKPKYVFNENSATPPSATNSITNGKVYDMYGKLMEGVEVSSISSGTSTTSNENGEFTLNGIKDKDDVLAEKNGYTHASTLDGENGLAVLMGGHGQQAVSKETIKIKGKVTDQSGEALPGASIIMSGTTYGTVSDINGEFILDGVRPDDEIVISFVGYETEVVQANGHKITLKMKRQVIQLEVNKEAPAPPPPPPPASGIEFRNIDGKTPLIVIDGKISKVDVSTLNTEYIQSMNVIKDEAAKAKYGDEGSNGVIEITTKRGNQTIRELQKQEEVFVIVEDMPKYPGGEEALDQYIRKAASKVGLTGKAYVTFTINTKGEVQDARVIRSTSDQLKAPALKIVKEMSKWKPGKQRGKPVNVTYTIVINF
ncbi:MAG: TonB family protein [Prolixibacteraceae bacterium]|jgi:TonB family protein|nr:TonB family protein [Prolixibacteraceae bacterium]